MKNGVEYMESGLTDLYGNKAKDDLMTIESAVQFLEQEAKPRTFSEILRKVGAPDNAKELLIAGLKEKNPALKEDSAKKNVRSWFQGSHNLEKATAFDACLILHFSPEQADEFVSRIFDMRLHWREPEEIVFLYALMHGYSCAQFVKLRQDMVSYFPKEENREKPSAANMTALIKEKVVALHSEQELKDFLRDSGPELGSLHNTAFSLFDDRLKQLEKPEQVYEGALEEKLTIREILREYMFGNNVLYAKEIARKTRKGELSAEDGLILSTIQKNVSDSWPNEATISKMRSRKIDVTRKALILLLLATDKGFQKIDQETGEEDDEYVPSKEEAYEDICGRMRNSLQSCGFPELDPRSQFDWMILYGICVQDLFEADLRMRGLFRTMFGERPEDGPGN